MNDDQFYLAVIKLSHAMDMSTGDLIIDLVDAAVRVALANKKASSDPQVLAGHLEEIVRARTRFYVRAIESGDATLVDCSLLHDTAGHG